MSTNDRVMYTNLLAIWGAAIPLLFKDGTVYAAASRHGYGRVFVNAHEAIQGTTTGQYLMRAHARELA
jgi:hypothetical protein